MAKTLIDIDEVALGRAKSALGTTTKKETVNQALAEVAAIAPLIESGLVATCGVTEFEIMWSTRSLAEFKTVSDDRSVGYEWLSTEDNDWRRAFEAQAELWSSARMRTVPLPDLLVAAVAERHRVTILHYDGDYDIVSGITG